jgi:hypothetical protein
MITVNESMLRNNAMSAINHTRFSSVPLCSMEITSNSTVTQKTKANLRVVK